MNHGDSVWIPLLLWKQPLFRCMVRPMLDYRIPTVIVFRSIAPDRTLTSNTGTHSHWMAPRQCPIKHQHSTGCLAHRFQVNVAILVLISSTAIGFTIHKNWTFFVGLNHQTLGASSLLRLFSFRLLLHDHILSLWERQVCRQYIVGQWSSNIGAVLQ